MVIPPTRRVKKASSPNSSYARKESHRDPPAGELLALGGLNRTPTSAP